MGFFTTSKKPTRSRTPPTSQKFFAYSPFDPLIPSIRLVILKPWKRHCGEDVCCELVEKPFVETPKYEALSYTWGDEHSRKLEIWVNGMKFRVRNNLWEALIKLRGSPGRKSPRTLWIDAICINQADILERNQQIPFMPHIYTYAQAVLIWLGSPLPLRTSAYPEIDDSYGSAKPRRYSRKHESDNTGNVKEERRERHRRHSWMPEDDNTEDAKETKREKHRRYSRKHEDDSTEDVKETKREKHHRKHEGYSSKDVKEIEGQLLPYLCRVDYWKRLWIIQEVIKAQKIEVHFNGGELDWDRFINGIQKQPELADCVPLKLTRQMRDKYGDACKLENLLKTYQNCLCKDPRDKVYGLVGLATDCHEGFPMDYGKTIFQVWKDLVMFQSASKTSNPRELVNFAQFAQRLFQKVDRGAGDGCTTSSAFDRGDSNPRLQTIASISGRIAHLGPTWKELMSSPNMSVQWKSSITKCVAEDDLPRTYEETDRLMQIIYKSEPSVLNRVSNFDRIQSYKLSGGKKHKLELYPHILPPSQDDIWFRRPEALKANQEPYLFVLDDSISAKRKGIARVGLAPPGAQIGDFICHYPQYERAIVARVHPDGGGVRLIGMAVVAQDCNTATQIKSSKSREASIWGVPSEMDSENTEVDLYIGVDTLCRLLL